MAYSVTLSNADVLSVRLNIDITGRRNSAARIDDPANTENITHELYKIAEESLLATEF
jgi:hypothetical protein